jgi:hypothetical protein
LGFGTWLYLDLEPNPNRVIKHYKIILTDFVFTKSYIFFAGYLKIAHVLLSSLKRWIKSRKNKNGENTIISVQ